MFFSEKTRFLFWVTHEKFQNPENFCFLFPKVFHRKGLKNGWKIVHGKSLSVRVRKNSGNFISNGPILLVWVTHGKFELEGLIRKLFTVEPRASGGVRRAYKVVVEGFCGSCWGTACPVYCPVAMSRSYLHGYPQKASGLRGLTFERKKIFF